MDLAMLMLAFLSMFFAVVGLFSGFFGEQSTMHLRISGFSWVGAALCFAGLCVGYAIFGMLLWFLIFIFSGLGSVFNARNAFADARALSTKTNLPEDKQSA